MLGDKSCRFRHFYSGNQCNAIAGAMLFNGRFALLMEREWGDLWKIIDTRMIHNNMHGPPFTENLIGLYMLEIAMGMKDLHLRNITHGDLKAANVLVGALDELNNHYLDPIHGHFKCDVADFECSVGVLGTGFWRSPEILEVVKTRNVSAKSFTKASDVYSYGMTCYEILTGCIPFEDFSRNDYDRVLGGCRPSLPSRTPWMKALFRRCWHKHPLERPTFEEIERILVSHLEGLNNYPELLSYKIGGEDISMGEKIRKRIFKIFLGR